MIEKHLAKLRARDDISEEEEAAILASVAEVIEVRADRRVVTAGETVNVCTILLSGIACRHKDLRDGSRQITELNVAGDYTDLHSFTLKRLDHDILALTDCSLAVVPHERLRAITEAFPHLARVYWFATNLDAAIHREWVLSLGRRTALARIAHLFCEMQVRLGLVGLAEPARYALPITQTDIAECLGLTSVHVNRTLKDLRERGVVEFRNGMVEIGDPARLKAEAEFDPAYLYLEKRVR
ncbi:Crp/Fnr family transcriptional regulator [Sphingomonas parva]|uniref:Crp/Fnr family transcriptional regulator n=1 Tax=Sphingomonas parva TaxID=2555898 RepID=A0A4Y8ZQK3_9SPHN|nr:Crp/Fnr family transcriptional regulator [Sphingomonas parva]TFI57562.1 Crp/Fnr family transcriptional regulator [Sphingomonas parva]